MLRYITIWREKGLKTSFYICMFNVSLYFNLGSLTNKSLNQRSLVVVYQEWRHESSKRGYFFGALHSPPDFSSPGSQI